MTGYVPAIRELLADGAERSGMEICFGAGIPPGAHPPTTDEPLPPGGGFVTSGLRPDEGAPSK